MNRWLQLTRLQTSGLTVGMLLITRWVAHGAVEVIDTLLLVVAGLLIHAGFFSMNEYLDRGHDEGHPHKVNPVTAGDLGERTALSLSLGTLTLSLALLLGRWGTWSWTTLPLLSSYVMGTSYNLRAKRFPRLAPWLLGGWVFLLSLWITGLSGFPARALWLPWAWGFMLLLQVLEGDLKDWEHDRRDPGGLDNHVRYMEYAQYAFIGSVGLVVFMDSSLFVTVLILGGVVGCMGTLIHVVQMRRFRDRMLAAMGMHNMVEYAMIVAVCLIWVDPQALLMVWSIPILMYGSFNYFGYGSAAAPAI